MVESELVLSGGLILEDGRRLARARLRALTGIEEEWLAEGRDLASAVKVTRILSACVSALDGEAVDAGRIRKLLTGDRDQLMLELRRITLGEDIAAVIVCPACSGPMDIAFKAGEVPVEGRPQTSVWYDFERGIRFRLPTGGDQEAVLGMEAEAAENALFESCVSPGVELTAEEREAVIAEMERLAPQVDLELDLTCPECGHGFVSQFDTTAFFFEEMRLKSGQLLREIHTLAFYYHWSEAEILSLGRRRRHAYLRLLSDSMRQE